MKQTLLILLTCFGLTGTAPLANASDEDFHGQDLSGKNFNGKIMNRANFSNAILKNAEFRNASLKSANFKGADLDRAEFENADMTGADLREATGTLNLSISRANLTNANLAGLSLRYCASCKFRGAVLRNTKFDGVLGGCDFSEADLCGANFRATSIGADTRLRGAIYDEDTAWPEGFDPKAAGAVLAKPEDKKGAAGAGKEKKGE